MEAILVTLALWQMRQPGGLNPPRGAGGGADAGLLLFQIFFQLLFAVPTIAGMWGVFAKAGRPGWAAIVPIYNIIVLLEITEKPLWWVVLFLCPCVGIVMSILVAIELAERFGQGGGFAAGLILLPFIFYPILGFGSAEYMGGRRRRRRVRDEDDEDRPRRRRRPAEDEDEDDRPRARRRPRAEEEDDEEDRPRRRRREDDDEDDDRIRERRR